MAVLGQLYLLFTPELCRHDPVETLLQAIDGGVELVQWRSKKPDRAGFDRCRTLCQSRRVPLIVNDDVMLALRSDVAGAHVGQNDMAAGAARKLLFGRWLGVSTHDLAQIQAAVATGVDYVGFGPCHATTTKNFDEGVGIEAIVAAVEACGKAKLPMFAIGGITADNLRLLRVHGVRRAAVSSFVLQHDDPQAAATALREALS